MSKPLKIALATVAALVIFRLCLPFIVKTYVNRTLNKIPGYRGHIEDIDIALIRGAYQIHRLEIRKLNGQVPVPFFSSETIDLSVQWKELFHGALVGEIEMVEPKLNFVVSKDKDKSQTSMDASWQNRVQELFPLDINQLVIKSGSIHFQNFDKKPPVDLYLRELEATAINLTNSRELSGTLFASLKGQGKIMERGFIRFNLQTNPYEQAPTFQMDVALEHAFLTEFNSFFVYYGGFNAEAGTVDVYMECAAKEGGFVGYVKPLIKEFKVIGDPKKELTLGQRIKEFFIALAAWVLKNSDTETVATRISFAGEFENPQTNTWQAVKEAFRHAFVKALVPAIENKIDLSNVKKPAK